MERYSIRQRSWGERILVALVAALVAMAFSIAAASGATATEPVLEDLGSEVTNSWTQSISCSACPGQSLEIFIVSDTGGGPLESPGITVLNPPGWSGSLVNPNYALATGPPSPGLFEWVIHFAGDINAGVSYDIISWEGDPETSEVELSASISAPFQITCFDLGFGCLKPFYDRSGGNANAAPVADANGPYVINEGDSLTLDASGSFDPDGDPMTFRWDVDGDGDFDENVTGVNPTMSSPALAALGLGDDIFVPNVTVEARDGSLASTASTSLAVINVDPSLSVISVDQPVVEVDAAINAAATFTDPGTADTHTAIWDWGDGTTTPGTVTQAAGSGSVDDTHTYSSPGVYTVTLSVTDDDGGVDVSAYEFVVVYDPSAGFVTGGGWIDSPAGAYVADPLLTGKANFGFVSKYKEGATVPTGSTEFQFKAGDLNFHSDSYDWLVIAGQDKAKYKGTGTINGTGNYGFMLTGVDNGNSGDTFRIKIWDKDNADAVVYDNQTGGDDSYAGTVIGGGNIKVHSK